MNKSVIYVVPALMVEMVIANSDISYSRNLLMFIYGRMKCLQVRFRV